MPIYLTNYDNSWDIQVDYETATLAQDRRYIIPLSNGCPRLEHDTDAMYDPQKERILDHKGMFTMFMLSHGYAQYLPTCYLVDFDQTRVINPIRPSPDEILLVKPVQGRNGQDIKLIRGDTDLTNYTDCVVSEYIIGDTEYIATLFCLNGQIMCSKYVAGQFSSEPYIKTQAIRGCLSVSDDLSAECNRCFKIIVEELGYSGIICANFKICERGLKIFELNPRMGATMISHRDLFNEFIRDVIIVLKDT